MAYTYNFKDDETYAASDINDIRRTLVTSGVIGFGANSCAVTAGNSGEITVGSGTAVFDDGSIINVDSDGVSLTPTANAVNYVYFFNDTIANQNIVAISTTQPSGDYVPLAEIDAEGVITDTRNYAVSRYCSLTAEGSVVSLSVNPSGTSWEYVGQFNVSHSLKCVTIHGMYDGNGNTSTSKSFVMGDTDLVVTYNSWTCSGVLKITPDYKLYIKRESVAAASANLIFVFSNASAGSFTAASAQGGN